MSDFQIRKINNEIGTKDCQVPERPPPPIVGKVTHHSIELYWDEALMKANKVGGKGDGRMKICVQEADTAGSWGNVYTGYAKKHIQPGLEPWTQYKYRIRFMNNNGNSDWSPSIQVSTVKEPLTGEHLHKAITMQDIDQMRRVLDTGDLNTVDTLDKYGFTPLMQASQKGLIEFMDELIEHGADINYQNDAGKTALMLACYAGKLGAIKELVHHGSKIGVQDKGGSTALHWAMDSKNTEVIEWLLDNGADIESVDYNGWTPLLRCAAVGGDKCCGQTLLRRPVKLNRRDKDGKTTLMIAVVNGHQDLVELLLDYNADVEIQNEYGKTAYEMAISMERRRVTKIIEEHMDKKGIKYHH